MIDTELSAPNGPAAQAGLRTWDDVERLLASVRGQRLVTFPESQMTTGFSGLTAPVFDHQDRTVAAITVAGMYREFDISLNGNPAEALLHATEGLSRRMGKQ
ncbi:MAG: hypothetical protein AB7E55_04855 [Pigmentiphaga sp.]